MTTLENVNFYQEFAEETSTASEDFKKNLMMGKRYVDKTMLLVPLLKGTHETTFYLRPRRFGKTLTLSMIHYFAEDTGDTALNEENRSLFRDILWNSLLQEKVQSHTRGNIFAEGLRANP